MTINDILKRLTFDPVTAATLLGTIAVTVLAATLLHKIFARSLRKLESWLVESKLKSHQPNQAQRVKTVVGLVQQVGTIIIVLLTITMVLDEIGLDIRPILAGAGVVGLAIGFGAQSLVKDFFTGFCLIVENQMAIGDWVTIGGKSGTVEVLNFRITVLRDAEGAIHIFPNGTIGMISNSTHNWSAAVLDLPVPDGQSFEQAAARFRKVGAEMRADEAWKDIITEDLEVQGVQDMTERGMIVRVRIKTKPGSHWSTGRNFRQRLIESWATDGMQVPRPTQNLYMVNPQGTKPQVI